MTEKPTHLIADWDDDGNARYTLVGVKTVSKQQHDAIWNALTNRLMTAYGLLQMRTKNWADKWLFSNKHCDKNQKAFGGAFDNLEEMK